MLCDLMSITCEPAGYYLQSLLVQWLCSNVDDQCAHWFETHWTGLAKGRYLLGSGRVGLVSNNQSLEAGWRWDSHTCTSGSQEISPILYSPSNILHIPVPASTSQCCYNFPICYRMDYTLQAYQQGQHLEH